MDIFFVCLDNYQVFWPAIILTGMVIGCMTGLFGVGGGFLLTPVLHVVFGLPYPLAVGTGLVLQCGTSSYAVKRHWRAGNVDRRLAIVLGLGALAGTGTGKTMMGLLEQNASTVEILGRSHSLLDMVMNFLFIFLMTGIGIYIWRETGSKDEQKQKDDGASLPRRIQSIGVPPRISFTRSNIHGLSLWIPLFLSFAVGILTGLLGVGGGFVNFPLLVYVIGVPTLVAVGTSSAQVTIASAFGSYLYFMEGKVLPYIVVLLLLGSLPGARLGTYLSPKLGGHKTKRYFALVLGAGVLVVIAGILLE